MTERTQPFPPVGPGPDRFRPQEIVEWTGNSQDELSREDAATAGRIFSPGGADFGEDSQVRTAVRMLRLMMSTVIPKGSSRQKRGGPSHREIIRQKLLQAGNQRADLKPPLRGFRLTQPALDLAAPALQAYLDHQKAYGETRGAQNAMEHAEK